MRRTLAIVALLSAVIVAFVIWILSGWNVSISIRGDSSLNGISFEILVDGMSRGFIGVFETKSVKLRPGIHDLSIRLKNALLYRETVDLPVFSLIRKKNLVVKLPEIGYPKVVYKTRDGIAEVLYNGPYPFDKWVLQIEGREFESKEGVFRCDFDGVETVAKLRGYIGDNLILSRVFVLKKELLNLNLELSGDERLLKHSRILLDGGEISPGSVRIQPGVHEIEVRVGEETVLSTEIDLKSDTDLILELPKLAELSSPKLRVSGEKVRISWEIERDGIKPEMFSIRSSFGEEKTVDSTSVDFPYHEATTVYTLQPFYTSERIPGESLELVKPSPPVIHLEGVTEISSNCEQTFEVHASSESEYEVFLNGRRVNSKKLSLSDGTNTLLVIARDEFGQVTSLSRELVCDRVPPEISYVISGDRLILNISEPATVLIEGRGPVRDRELPLADLPASFTVRAIDRAGNVSKVLVRLFEKPEIEVGMLKPDEIHLSIHYDLPFDVFSIEIDGEVLKTDATDLRIRVPLRRDHTVKISAVYRGRIGPARSVNLINDYVKTLSGTVRRIEGGLYEVSRGLILDNPILSGDSTFLVADDAQIVVKGEVEGGGMAFFPLEKRWKGLIFTGGNLSNVSVKGAEIGIRVEGSSTLNNVVVEDSEVGLYLSDGNFVVSNLRACGDETSIMAMEAVLYVKDSLFMNSDVALNLSDSIVVLKDSSFLRNEIGVDTSKGRLVVMSSIFKGNGDGVKSLSSEVWVYGSVMDGNTVGIRASSSCIRVKRTEFSNNSKGVYLYNHEKGCSIEFCSFKNNKIDIFVKGENDIAFKGSPPQRIVDGSVQPRWVDDRGRIRKRGKVVMEGGL